MKQQLEQQRNEIYDMNRRKLIEKKRNTQTHRLNRLKE